MIESDAIRAAVEELRLKAPSPYQASNLSEGQWPWSLRLSAWADEVAADLHGRFSDLVITLGYLRYPDRIPERTIDLDATSRSSRPLTLRTSLSVSTAHWGSSRDTRANTD